MCLPNPGRSPSDSSRRSRCAGICTRSCCISSPAPGSALARYTAILPAARSPMALPSRWCVPNSPEYTLRPMTIAHRTFILAALALGACNKPRNDADFAAMQARGQHVMGVDQYASAHVFEDLPDGGRIILDRADAADTAAITTIRKHMRDIVTAFRAGDFTKPFQVHAQTVPGTAVMAARRDAISYEAVDRPRGGEVRIRSSDASAIAAIHEFLAFQRGAHHAASHVP